MHDDEIKYVGPVAGYIKIMCACSLMLRVESNMPFMPDFCEHECKIKCISKKWCATLKSFVYMHCMCDVRSHASAFLTLKGHL